MATTKTSIGDVSEWCDTCEGETPHHVNVSLLTESASPENAEFSREPYRVSECSECGSISRTRMNNA